MIITIVGPIIGLITLLSSVIIVSAIYLHKKSKRARIWQATTNTHAVISSAPISRRSSSSCLANLEKLSQSSRSRSASFSEDLSARLQILTANTCYHSYSPAIIDSPSRSTRPSLNTNIRYPIVSNSSSTIPSITFQLRYEQTTGTLFITIFQLHNYSPSKNTQYIFLILYLLPNDDEQRQTQSSINGVFNEYFPFPLKSEDVLKRTLRLTVHTVDSTTRIRNILGHVFLKFDRFIDENTNDKTFSTNTLSECLSQDLQIRSDYLGELILTSCYLKDQNLIQIRIQRINNLHIDQTKIQTPLKAHLSGQTASTCHKHHWINTSTFIIPSSSSSFRIDQELNLTTRSSPMSENENHIECHLRLHLHGFNQIHSHARWQHVLRSSLPTTLTVPLVAL